VGAAAVALLTACTGDGTLVVQVRTDLLPATDFASVDVVVTGEDGVEHRFERAAREDRSWGSGVRAAEATLPSGTYRARIAAVDASGAAVVERPVSVELTGGEVRVMTVVLTRDCRGVECPLSDGSPSQVACLAGRCVDEGCTEETPELCGEPECASAADCGSDPVSTCASWECTASGACVEVLDHAMCGEPGSVCSAAGCVPESGGPLSAPGPGHVHIVVPVGGYFLYRLELREGAPLQDVSAALDAVFPTTDPTQDESAGLSRNGEWMTAVTERGGGFGVLVAPVRDPSAGDLIDELTLTRFAGTAVTDDGRRVVFVENDHLRLLTSESGDWAIAPTPLTAESPMAYHRQPSLIPDQDRVLMLCSDGDDVDAGICEVGLDGSGFRARLPPGSFPDQRVGYPRAMADRSVIFHVQSGPGAVQLWRVPPDGPPAEVAFPDLPAHSEPCVLPDGRIVARDYDSVRFISADGRAEASVELDLPSGTEFHVDSCGL
jgi:hypothetical protein